MDYDKLLDNDFTPVYDGQGDKSIQCRADVEAINRDYNFSIEFQKTEIGGFALVVPYDECVRLKNCFAVDRHSIYGRTKEIKDRLELAGFGIDVNNQLINVIVRVWII